MVNASVIIPAHNEERHIEGTIRSLLEQDLKDIEIIIVDNGSKDKTAEIVSKYVALHPDRVKLIKLDFNAGPGGARNIGAKAARGEVLVFLDADMIFPPDFIRKLVTPIAAGKCLATVHAKEFVGNLENAWVKVQGQVIKYETTKDEWPGFRAISRRYFLEQGGFDPSFGYHDDRFLRGGVMMRALVVKDAMCYHNNPDSASEIFRRNYWMGRTLIAISLYEGGLKGLRWPLYVLIARALDLSALPLFGISISMLITRNDPIIATLMLLPITVFLYQITRQRLLNVRNTAERVKLKLLYAPAYRILRAAGIFAGVAVSLLRGLKVSPRNGAEPSRSQSPSPDDRSSRVHYGILP